MKTAARLLLLAAITLCAVLFAAACQPDSGDDDDDDSVDGDDDNDDASPPAWNEPETPLRRARSLDGTWSFTPEGYETREVPVPCFWEAIPAWDDWLDYACPEYLAGTPDEMLDMNEGSGWDQRTVHNGTYELSIPLDDPLPVTRIRFEALHHRATVFLNDVEIGTHIGAYWPAVFDLSPAVHAGENGLRVEMEDGQALIGDLGATLYPAGYYAHTDITGIYRSVVLEELPEVYIEDVFVVPSIRRGDLTCEVTLINTASEDRALWVLGRVVDAEGETAVETEPQEVLVPAGGTTSVVTVTPWENAERWTPVTPVLYTLRTLLEDAGGEPADLKATGFGFREVWIEDGHFVLNGQRVNFFGDNIDDQASRARYWGPKYFSCVAVRETFRRLKEELNINLVRFHQAPPEDCVHDAADEMGIMLISESAIYARTDIVPPFSRDERYAENSREWLSNWVRFARRHPSVVMWSVENEMFMYGFGMTMDQVFSLQWPAKEADSIVRPDGAATDPRPVSWDGDGSFLWWFYPGVPETVNWHYPALRRLTIYPGNEWFTDAVAHYEPYLIPGVPTGVGETMIVRRDEEPGRTLDMAKALQGSAVRAMRILGFSDIRPYKLNWAWHDFDPEGREHPWAPYYHGLYTEEQKERLVKHLRESYHPIAVFDRDYTRVGPNEDGTFDPVPLPGGATVERTLVALNDSFLPDGPERIGWSLVNPATGEALEEDEMEVIVPQGESTQIVIEFATPAVDTALELELRLTAEMDGLPNGAFTTEYRFVVEP